MAKRGFRPRTRKPAMAKAKAMVTKQHKKKAKRNMDTFFFKSKVLAQLVPQQGLQVSNFVYTTFTMDPTGVPQGSSAQFLDNAEFNLYRMQYDKYRVNSVKVTFVPKANVLDLFNAQNDAAINASGDGCVHTCIDRDGIAPQSIARISRYPSYRKYSLLKKFSRTYAVKYPTGVWIDCQNQANFSMAKELGLTGGLTIYAENVLEDNLELWNEAWASVIIEHNIVFQGKTSAGLLGVYDEGGNLTGITVAAPEYEVQPGIQSPVRNIRGTLHDYRLTQAGTLPDLSGEDVPITDAPTA